LGRSRLGPERATRKRREKSAEAVVAASDRDEGPNGEESETSVRLGGKGPQMSKQLELRLEGTGEAQRAKRSEEAPTAARGKERPDGAGVRAREPSGRAEASEEEQGQPRHRRDDGGRAFGPPAHSLARASRAIARGHVPARAGAKEADPEERRWGTRARHPD